MYSDFYKKYQKARNLSWEIILKYNISSLPVSILDLCKDIGIKVYSYQTADKLIRMLDLSKYLKDNDGLSIKLNDTYIILYDNTIEPFARRRFTVSHEMGHILQGHLEGAHNIMQWNKDGDEPNEYEAVANVFASRLLAPACVLKELDISTVEELVSLTGLSYTAAEIRLKRLNEVKQRNKFYLSPQEKKVYKQFEEFINNYKNK